MKIKERNNNLTIGLLFIGIILPILSINLFTFFWLDDYGNLQRLKKENFSIIESMIYFYNNWDGRNLSIAGFWKFLTLKYFPAEIVTLSYTIFWLFNLFLIIKITEQEIEKKISNKLVIAILTVLSLILFYGSRNHIAQTIFWAGGGIYTTMLTFGLIWIYFVNHLSKRSNISTFQHIIIFFFSINVGMLSQNLSTSLIAYIFTKWLLNSHNRNFRKIVLLNIIAIIIGTIIISVAPGNFIRAEHNDNSFKFSLITVIEDFFKINIIYLMQYKQLILFLLVAFFLYLYLNHAQKIKSFISAESYKIIKPTLPYLLATISTVIPFTILRGFYGPRTSIFFEYFLVITLLILCCMITLHYFKLNTFRRKTFLIIVLIIVGFHNYYMINALKVAYQIKSQIKQRENIALNSQGKDLTFIDLSNDDKLPFFYQFTDLSDDSTFFHNRSYARIYNLKSVRTIKP